MRFCKKKLHLFEGKQCKECRKAWRTKNKENLAKVHSLYAKNNKQKFRDYNKKSRLKTLDKKSARDKQYKIAKKTRVPKWLSFEQKAEIKEFYVIARELQWLNDPTDKLTVDHIIPLRGKHVSGLHVPWNLRIIQNSINSSKSNKLD